MESRCRNAALVAPNVPVTDEHAVSDQRFEDGPRCIALGVEIDVRNHHPLDQVRVVDNEQLTVQQAKRLDLHFEIRRPPHVDDIVVGEPNQLDIPADQSAFFGDLSCETLHTRWRVTAF